MTARRRFGVGVSAVLALAVLMSTMVWAGSAAANQLGGPPREVTLNGDWEAFNRCPVDDPRMLAATGEETVAFCIATESPAVLSVKGINLLEIANTNAQFGAIYSNAEGSGGLANVAVVQPRQGAVITTPGTVAGGLQTLICPGNDHRLADLCRHRSRHELETVVGTLTEVGFGEKADLTGGFQVKVPIVTADFELHLWNPLLGPHCFIGSVREPIAVSTELLGPPAEVVFQTFEGNGTPFEPSPEYKQAFAARFVSSGATEGEENIAIPAAHGCGPHGWFDRAIDMNLGLPAASGNSLVHTNVTSYIGSLENLTAGEPEGHQLAAFWHSAVISSHGGDGGR